MLSVQGFPLKKRSHEYVMQHTITFYSCMRLACSFQPKFRPTNIYTCICTCMHLDKIKSVSSHAKLFLKLQKSQAEIQCVSTSWLSHLLIYSGKIRNLSITVMKKNGMYANIYSYCPYRKL